MANFVDVHRQRVTTPGAPRWPLRWLPNRLWPGRGMRLDPGQDLLRRVSGWYCATDRRC